MGSLMLNGKGDFDRAQLVVVTGKIKPFLNAHVSKTSLLNESRWVCAMLGAQHNLAWHKIRA